jgi:lipopolysaccharide transport system permease protein
MPADSALPESAAPGGGPEVVIEHTSGLRGIGLHELVGGRHLIGLLAWRDLRTRYRHMALGPLWAVLQPLTTMVLFTVLLGYIAKLPSEGLPYPVFAFVALVPWGLFSSAASSAAGSLAREIQLISKVYFPRLTLPLAAMVPAIVDFAISFLVLVGMLAFYRMVPRVEALFVIPLAVLIACLTGLGFGLLFSGIQVRFRDFAQVLGYVVRFWMYATPVVYSASVIPDQFRWVLLVNPMAGVVEMFRWALARTEMALQPGWIAMHLGIALLLCVAGALVLRSAERDIVDFA